MFFMPVCIRGQDDSKDIFKSSYQNKKLILDVVVEDDHGRLYDFEMNNYDIQLEDEIRFLRYSER